MGIDMRRVLTKWQKASCRCVNDIMGKTTVTKKSEQVVFEENNLIEADANEFFKIHLIDTKKDIEINWIPITEKLPEEFHKDIPLYNRKMVLATLKNGIVCEMWWFGLSQKFYRIEGMEQIEFIENPVVAWMSMPRPFVQI